MVKYNKLTSSWRNVVERRNSSQTTPATPARNVIDLISINYNQTVLGDLDVLGNTVLRRNVGIGKSSSNYSLDVSGNINFTGNLLQNGINYDSGYWSSTNSIDIFNNGTGNVGINNPLPTYTLDVSGSLNSTGLATLHSANITNDTGMGGSLDVSGNTLLHKNVGIGKSSSDYTLDVSGNINFTGNLLQNGINYGAGGWSSTNGIDIFNSTTGNVGINNSLPTYTLDVSGTLHSTGLATLHSANITNDTGISGSLNVSGNTSLYGKLDVSGNTLFHGSVGIGKISPDYTLDVCGNIGVNGPAIFSSVISASVSPSVKNPYSSKGANLGESWLYYNFLDASGSFTYTGASPITVYYLAVGAGMNGGHGSGTYAGAGGAGGNYLTGSFLMTNGTYKITVPTASSNGNATIYLGNNDVVDTKNGISSGTANGGTGSIPPLTITFSGDGLTNDLIRIGGGGGNGATASGNFPSGGGGGGGGGGGAGGGGGNLGNGGVAGPNGGAGLPANNSNPYGTDNGRGGNGLTFSTGGVGGGGGGAGGPGYPDNQTMGTAVQNYNTGAGGPGAVMIYFPQSQFTALNVDGVLHVDGNIQLPGLSGTATIQPGLDNGIGNCGMQFLTSYNSLAMCINPTTNGNNYVGIGTNAPAYTLDVSGIIHAGDFRSRQTAGVFIVNGGTSLDFALYQSVPNLAIATNQIHTSGSVSSADWQLAGATPAGAQTYIFPTNLDNYSYFRVNPGYGILTYSGTNYTGTLESNFKNKTNYPAFASFGNNKQSVKIFYNDVECL
jgi:hypothetical protein